MEGSGTGKVDMTLATEMSSGKGGRDENFPVASLLIRPAHREVIKAFYAFARESDDVADHPTSSTSNKFEVLEQMRTSLIGESDDQPSAVKLRKLILDHGLDFQHPLDLLAAFRMDVTKRRYRDWNELLEYCMLSAAPVGRFVLDVHGESRDRWRASDPLCVALQIINHLQDCGRDYRELDRVYVPLDALNASGVTVEALGIEQAPSALLGVIGKLALRTQALLDSSRPLSREVDDPRLAMEIAVIHSLAGSLASMLTRRDPLSENVHHNPFSFAALGLWAVLRASTGRICRRSGGALTA